MLAGSGRAEAPLTPAAARNAFIAVVGATIAKAGGRFQP